MTRRNCFARIAFCAGLWLLTGSLVLPQDSPDKGVAEQSTPAKSSTERKTAEQNQAEKTRPESTIESNSLNFPSPQGPVELHPARGTRITLKLTDTSRVVYETLGRQAKINVLFDPDYVPRNISVDLNNVSLDDALKIVAFQARTFWRPVTSDTIFVAADTPAKRREFEQQIIKTFYFPNVSRPTDLQDIVNGIRTLVEVPRIQQMPSFQTITVRATPEQMAITEKLIDDINRAKQKTGGEYRLEFKITEVSGDKKGEPKTYVMLVEPHQSGKIRTGSKVPILVSDKEKTYTDVGKKIDCEIRLETEHTVSLHLTVESSEVAPDAHTPADTGPLNPVIQQAMTETSVTLELGTPSIVGNFQDPVSKHNFQIEATATRTKSKE
jgi:hypothetical protein